MSQAISPANQARRIKILRLAFILMLPLLIIVEPAYSDTSILDEALEPFGALLVIAGVLGRFWAILYIGGRKNREVVQTGPYSMCRHPLYLFSTIATLGLGFLLGSFLLALIVGGLTFAILFETARREEAFLEAEFGAAYAAYAAKTPLILPRISLFHTPPAVAFSVRHLRGNMFDAFVFLSFIPMAELIDYAQESWGLTLLYLY